jgi:hypothetical protein
MFSSDHKYSVDCVSTETTSATPEQRHPQAAPPSSSATPEQRHPQAVPPSSNTNIGLGNQLTSSSS